MHRRLALALFAAAASADGEPPATQTAGTEPGLPPINDVVRLGFTTTALRATNCIGSDKAVELARTRVEQGASAAYDKLQLYAAQHQCAVSDFSRLEVGPLMYQGHVDGRDIVVVRAANYNEIYVLLVASYDQRGI
jgi:hypothetical protein